MSRGMQADGASYEEAALACTVRELHGRCGRVLERLYSELGGGGGDPAGEEVWDEIRRVESSKAHLGAALRGWRGAHEHLRATYEGCEVRDRLRRAGDFAPEDPGALTLERPVAWFLARLWRRYAGLHGDGRASPYVFYTMVMLLVMYGGGRLGRDVHTRRALGPLLRAIELCEGDEFLYYSVP